MKWMNALPCGLLIICGCSDFVGVGSHQSFGGSAEGWVGRYVSAVDTLVVDGVPTFVQAHLDLYLAPACQFHVEFSTDDPHNWLICHSDSCMYYLERGAVTVVLTMRVHYEGGNDLIDVSARFEPVDNDWTAVVWTKMGIRLESDPPDP